MWVPLLLLLPELLPAVPAQKLSALTFLRVDQDKDRECSLDCAGSPQKSLCASDGRTFLSRCEFQRAKCKDPQLEIAYRGNCKDVSRCVAERKYTQEQARKEFQQVFIPECNDDGTYSQVQCHSYTGYCWCVTPNGRPISGTAVAHKTPRCPGSVSEKLPQREGAGKAAQACGTKGRCPGSQVVHDFSQIQLAPSPHPSNKSLPYGLNEIALAETSQLL